MATDKKIICPLMGKQCIEDGAVVDGELHACRFWVYVTGKNPQDGTEIKQGDCAHAWVPVLLIENSKLQRETGAAVESMRNESVTSGQHIGGALLSMLRAHQASDALAALNSGNQKLIQGE